MEALVRLSANPRSKYRSTCREVERPTARRRAVCPRPAECPVTRPATTTAGHAVLSGYKGVPGTVC